MQRAWPHRPSSGSRNTSTLRLIAVGASLAVLAGCGRETGTSSASKQVSGGRTTALASPQYVQAMPSCAAPPAPGSSQSIPTHVSGYRVCGPFAANAGSSLFACPSAGGAGPYRLLVYNGAPDGVARTSSARFRVDGVEVIGPSAFDQQVSAATARVVLTPASTVEVAIADGGALRLEVVDESQTCSILAPVDVYAAGFKATVSTANAFPIPQLQLFNGGLDGASRTNKGEVRFGGAVLVPRNDIREKVSAVFAPVSLPGLLTAQAGERGYFTLEVVDRDVTPPAFAIDSPADLSFTNQPQVAVSGTIDDPSALVKVNGVLAAVAAGHFTGQAQLSPCWNTIRVEAGDLCSNASAASVRVGLDTTPPVVEITAPANGLLSNRASQHVRVQYSDDFSGVDPASVRVTLDGTDVTASLVVGAAAAEGDLSIPEGVHTLQVQLADHATNPASATSTFTIDLTPPALSIVNPVDGSQANLSPVSVMITYADALSGVNASTLTISLDGKDVTSSFASGPVSAGASIALAAGSHQLQVSVADFPGNVAQATSAFVVKNAVTGPPDPAQVAPPNDLTVTTDIAASTAFLYSGENPIQTGVAPGTIEAKRAAVIRGQVYGRDSTPIAGAHVTIVGHPELGSTLTREDGMFDLAVNGGGSLTVNFQKDGFLPAQRKVDVPWRDFVWVPPVALVAFDTVSTELRSGAAAMQVARGSPMTDNDGTRQATVLLPSGTSASMSLPDGSTSPLGTFHVRATEYTVGATGGMAMPAELPPTTGYTYAVELSVDEAVIAGAGRVSFSQPVPVYLENFLGIAVGLAVPSGYYDRTLAAWIPSDDGRVIRVLSTTGGIAAIDTNGDGIAEDPATLTSIGITLEERQQLAVLYAPGQTLWRVPVPHFTAYDFNGGFGCKADSDGNACPGANAPPPGFGGGGTPCPTTTGGSIIDCENQGLGEDVKITGTGLSLSYRSLRQLGRKAERAITLHLPTKISSEGLGIVYEVYVAGQRLTQRTTSVSATDVTYVWDGRDAYKRPVQGAAPVLVRIGVIYHPVLSFVAVASGGRSFGTSSHGSTAGIYSRYDNCVTSCPVPDGAHVGSEFVAWTSWQGTLSSFTELPKGLGGWSLSNVHQYDPVAKVVYRGDGDVQGATPLDSHVISTYGTVPWPVGMAIAPDGTVYTSNCCRAPRMTVRSRISRELRDGEWPVRATTAIA